MGLDMYAYQVINPEEPSPTHLLGEADYQPLEGALESELHYWRKHPNLHGWMEKLYYKKGGRAESFNCVNVVLNKEDLNQLEYDLEAYTLPETEGFFFGKSNKQDIKNDLEFVKKAKEAINKGHIVYYTSWW